MMFFNVFRRRLLTVGFCGVCLLVPSACTNDTDDERILSQSDIMPDTHCRYRLTLRLGFDGFAPSTRSTTPRTWNEDDHIQLLFRQGSTSIRGTAVLRNGQWEVSTDSPLQETDEDVCRAVFLPGIGLMGNNNLMLSIGDAAYTTENAAWSLIENELTVTGTLSPLTGRVRFAGQPGSQHTVREMAYASLYHPSTLSFTTTATTQQVTVGSDGFSPYYYVAFANDTRSLIVENSATSGFRHDYSEAVLAPGSSGFITIPTAASHEGWTLVNLTNQQPITLATLTAITAVKVRSKQATLKATATSAGNGQLTLTGFVVSTSASPTTANATVISCGIATTLQATVMGLLPETTYHVRAFATNEAGTAYGPELAVTTIAEADDPSIYRDDYQEDEEWTDDTNGGGNFGKTGYDDDDEDWN